MFQRVLVVFLLKLGLKYIASEASEEKNESPGSASACRYIMILEVSDLLYFISLRTKSVFLYLII